MLTTALQLQLFLAAYAVAVVLVVPRALPRCAWLHARPRWGMTAWLSAIFAVLSSTLLLAVSVAFPVERVDLDLGHLLHACFTALGRGSETVTFVSVIVLGAVLSAAGVYLSAVVLRARNISQRRRRQRELLDLLDPERDASGAYVLDHEIPLAYCVPGRRGRVVFTSAARDLLSAEQLEAVIAHEQAHLRGRHNLLLLAAESGVRAFPWSNFFRTARQQIAGLIEMLADDWAAGRAGKRPLVAALVQLGQRNGPEGTLGATEHLTIQRVLRLTDDGTASEVPQRWSVLSGAVLLVGIPWLVLGLPLMNVLLGLCQS